MSFITSTNWCCSALPGCQPPHRGYKLMSFSADHLVFRAIFLCCTVHRGLFIHTCAIATEQAFPVDHARITFHRPTDRAVWWWYANRWVTARLKVWQDLMCFHTYRVRALSAKLWHEQIQGHCKILDGTWIEGFQLHAIFKQFVDFSWNAHLEPGGITCSDTMSVC